MGRTEFRPKDYMRTFVIDDEFFNQSAIEATPQSSCRPALEKLLDTADIIRDGRKTGYPEIWSDPEVLIRSPTSCVRGPAGAPEALCQAQRHSGETKQRIF